jgi:hypothetical protein
MVHTLPFTLKCPPSARVRARPGDRHQFSQFGLGQAGLQGASGGPEISSNRRSLPGGVKQHGRIEEDPVPLPALDFVREEPLDQIGLPLPLLDRKPGHFTEGRHRQARILRLEGKWGDALVLEFQESRGIADREFRIPFDPRMTNARGQLNIRNASIVFSK